MRPGNDAPDNLDKSKTAFHEKQYERLVSELEAAAEKSELPESPSCMAALSDLLVRLRLR